MANLADIPADSTTTPGQDTVAAPPAKPMHPATAAILRHFEFSHLPAELASVSSAFHAVAHGLARGLDGPEVTAGLRKLLEAKDCFVRAAVDRGRGPQPPARSPGLRPARCQAQAQGPTALPAERQTRI